MRVLRGIVVLAVSLIGSFLVIWVGATVGEILSEVFAWPKEPALAEGLGGFLFLVLYLAGLVYFLAHRRTRRIVRVLAQEQERLGSRQEGDPFVLEAEYLFLAAKQQYEVVRNHANVSLATSLIALFLTLIAILGTLYFGGMFGAVGDRDAGFWSALSGLISALSGFMGATFLLIYRQASRELQTCGQQIDRDRKKVAALRATMTMDEEGARIRTEWARLVLGLDDEPLKQVTALETQLKVAGG